MKTIKELLGLSEAKKKNMKGEDPCWDNYEMVGTKKKNGKEVPNCVPKNEELELEEGSMASQWKSGAKSIKKGSVELVRGQGVHTIKKDGKEIGDFSLDDDAGNWVINWNKKKPGRGQGVHDHIDDIVDAALKEEVEIYEAKVGDTVSFHHELKAAPGTKMKKSGTVEKVRGDDVLVKVKDRYGVKRHQVKMSDLVKENFGADFLAMARQKNPNARLVTPEQKKKEAEELAKKRAGLKPTHAAPTGNSRPLGGYDPKSNRSYSEEVESVAEASPKDKIKDDDKPFNYADWAKSGKKPRALPGWGPKGFSTRLFKDDPKGKKDKDQGVTEGVEQVDELNKDTVYSYNKKSTAETEKLHKKLGEFIRSNKPSEANKTAHKLNKRVAGQERADARMNTEETVVEEAPSIHVRTSYTQAYAKHHKTGKKPSEAVAAAYEDVAKKHGYDMVKKLKAHHAANEQVETAAQVVKHFEKGQSTPSGVPKWVAEPLKKKKKVQEAGDPEMMGGAVSRPTASGNNPKLADKFMKAFKKMKSPANISCKTVGMTSTCEDTEQEFNNMFTEAMKKKPEPNSKQNLKKGEKLSGKQEPITISPEIEKKGVA
jgi:hypothetical protein